jgi:dTDP-4-amino-4,6-dideoxygalactose transaminase
VIPVHLFGLAAEMDPILEIARRHELAVIEDAACAIGTSYRGAPVGGLGDVGCFSFHPRKIITTGEGGAVTTRREDLARRVQSLRNHGSTGLRDARPGTPAPWDMSSFDLLGYNLRMSDIQAAVGIAQMAKLEALLRERVRCAAHYDALLADVPDLAPPQAREGSGHTYQSYVVRVRDGGRERRNRVMELLEKHDIQTRPGTHAVHRLGYYARKYHLKAEDYPVAALCEDTTITLPLFPGMSEAEQEQVVSHLREGLSA